MRNLDTTTLRSFVAVAEHGGVTRAAGALHLTQSAVSMQLKRLEEMLDLNLLDRSNRTISLTSSGEQLLSYARRMLALNDEAVMRLTDTGYEGEVILGVPYDIIYPVIPPVLRRYSKEFPRVKLSLKSLSSTHLHDAYQRGEIDLILTTEPAPRAGGEVLCDQPLVWVGAHGGQAWKDRPLRLAFCKFCMFRPVVIERLDAAGIEWEMSVEAEDDSAATALVSADQAVGARLVESVPSHLTSIQNCGGLPELGVQQINLYTAPNAAPPIAAMAEMLRHGYTHSKTISQLKSA